MFVFENNVPSMQHRFIFHLY